MTNTLLRGKRHCETIGEALQGAEAHLTSGAVQNQIEELFEGDFGESPELEIALRIRKDPATPDRFTYKFKTRITHPVGSPVLLHGLEND